MPGMGIQDGLKVDQELTEGGPMPFAGCSMFAFATTQRPECILRLDREGGIMIACDSLQNWMAPDELFDEETVGKMQRHRLLHADEPRPRLAARAANRRPTISCG